MANKSKDNKNLIIGICAAIVVVIVIIIAVVLANRGSNGMTGLSDSYFVSDGTKYSVTFDTDEEGELAHVKEHLVYTYSGDKVTGLRYYYEFKDAETAKKAYEYYTSEEAGLNDSYKEIALDGKYVILVANESEYADLTAEDAKQQIEFLEEIYKDSSDEEEIVEDEVEEESVELIPDEEVDE